MRIAVGADHRGFQTKTRLVAFLESLGHEVLDCGSDSPDPSDYPDFAVPPCAMVARQEADRAILMCGSGIGMTMVANKIPGIRAALCHDELTAEMSRRHNNANVLCLPADLLGEELIRRMVETWLSAPFDAGRHERRVAKIMSLEEKLRQGIEDLPVCEMPPPEPPRRTAPNARHVGK